MTLVLTLADLPITASCLAVGPMFMTAHSFVAESTHVTLALGSEEGAVCLYDLTTDKGGTLSPLLPVHRLETRARVQALLLFDATRFGSMDLIAGCAVPLMALII
jgi:hypothetical protein